MNSTTDEKTTGSNSDTQTLMYYLDGKVNSHIRLSTGEYINQQFKQKNKAARTLYIDTKTSWENKYELSFDTSTMPDINFLIGKDGGVHENEFEKFKNETDGYDHIIIANLDDFIFIHVGDNEENRRFKRAALIELFGRLRFDRHKHGTTVSILSSAQDNTKTLLQSIEQPVNGRLFKNIALADTSLPSLSRCKSNSEQTTNGFFDDIEERTTPKTGVYRMDYILAQNKAQWGDMVFFATKESTKFTQYAIDSIISYAPIRVPLLHIAPFRTAREVKESLKTLDQIAPLSTKAAERTTFISSEHFRDCSLDDQNALMGVIKEAIGSFRSSLDAHGADHGICLIDTVMIDTYGAALDYPSLRWYAKSNDILIIIGADKTEERYTFSRKPGDHTKKIEKNTKNPQLTQTV